MIPEVEPIEWTEDDKANFYTACDELDKAMNDAGATALEVVNVISFYMEQKRSLMVYPSTVVDRMAQAASRWQARTATKPV